MKKKQWSSLLCCALMAGFLLGVHNGNIALWKDNNTQPVKVFDYPISNLPEDAQKQLQAGVPVKNLRELRKLAEQYLP